MCVLPPSSIHYLDDGDSTHLWNVGLLQRYYTALYLRRFSSPFSPQREPEISHSYVKFLGHKLRVFRSDNVCNCSRITHFVQNSYAVLCLRGIQYSISCTVPGYSSFSAIAIKTKAKYAFHTAEIFLFCIPHKTASVKVNLVRRPITIYHFRALYRTRR
jgi:hypothetical protein